MVILASCEEEQHGHRASKQRVLLFVAGVLLIVGVDLYTLGDDRHLYFSGRTTPRAAMKGTSTGNQTHGYTHLPLTFGHIHMAKTAGTNLNGEFAAKYERICGNKGYSFDAFQTNERRRKSGNLDSVANIEGDTITKVYQSGWNRGRVPLSMMQERGFEDCDWISAEEDWTFWKQFADWDLPIEIHVPCRDPIDHLLSQCNYRLSLIHI